MTAEDVQAALVRKHEREQERVRSEELRRPRQHMMREKLSAQQDQEPNMPHDTGRKVHEQRAASGENIRSIHVVTRAEGTDNSDMLASPPPSEAPLDTTLGGAASESTCLQPLGQPVSFSPASAETRATPAPKASSVVTRTSMRHRRSPSLLLRLRL